MGNTDSLTISPFYFIVNDGSQLETRSSVAITGTFERSIDDKLRLAIPRRLREALDIADGGEL